MAMTAWPRARPFESPIARAGSPDGVDLHDGQVGGARDTDDLARELATIGERDADGGRPVDNVGVGQDPAAAVEDEPRSNPGAGTAPRAGLGGDRDDGRDGPLDRRHDRTPPVSWVLEPGGLDPAGVAAARVGRRGAWCAAWARSSGRARWSGRPPRWRRTGCSTDRRQPARRGEPEQREAHRGREDGAEHGGKHGQPHDPGIGAAGVAARGGQVAPAPRPPGSRAPGFRARRRPGHRARRRPGHRARRLELGPPGSGARLLRRRGEPLGVRAGPRLVRRPLRVLPGLLHGSSFTGGPAWLLAHENTLIGASYARRASRDRAGLGGGLVLA